MGALQSRESYLQEEIKSPRLNRDTLRFPGFKEKDEEFLKHRQDIQAAFDHITDIIKRLTSFMGLPDAIGYILPVAKSQICDSSIKDAMLELKIEKTVVNTVHSLVQAEMSSITRQLSLINDPQLSEDVKRTHLAIADDACYRLHVKFCDDGFYLRRYPLAFAPFLLSFVAVYVPIATANYQATRTKRRREEYVANMKQMRNTVVYFKEKAIKERLKYIEQNFPGEENPFISDMFLKENPVIHILFYTSPNVFKDVYNWYTEKVSKKYAEYFQQGLHVFDQLELNN